MLAVTALMQAWACRIQRKQRFVIQKIDFNHIPWAVLFEPFGMVGFLQLLNNGFLDNPLAGRDAAELGFMRPAFDREFAMGRNPILPRESLSPLEQFIKRNGGELTELHQHTVRSTEPQITAADINEIACEIYASVLHSNIFIS
ncbi:hypothetical protein D3C72_1203260 [compost metagenome]